MNLPEAGDPSFWTAPDGRRLAWYEFGLPDGIPLMFYHGWPSSGSQAAMLHHLANERGIRVIAMDRPGMGYSEYVPGRTLADWPERIAAFADFLGVGPFLQLGVSGGGPYVPACVARMPDRVIGSAVLCGAVPISGNTQGFHPIYRLLFPLRKLPPGFFSMLLKVAKWMIRDGGGQKLRWIAKSLPEADRLALESDPQTIPHFIGSFERGIAQGGRGVMGDAAIYFQACPIDFRRVETEIHYWHGAVDFNIPLAKVREFTDGIPGACLEIDPDLGHYSLALYRASEAMDYLAERWTGAHE
jgi:pimeloyl-ACP methyl ester carboxylesterase